MICQTPLLVKVILQQVLSCPTKAPYLFPLFCYTKKINKKTNNTSDQRGRSLHTQCWPCRALIHLDHQCLPDSRKSLSRKKVFLASSVFVSSFSTIHISHREGLAMLSVETLLLRTTDTPEWPFTLEDALCLLWFTGSISSKPTKALWSNINKWK